MSDKPLTPPQIKVLRAAARGDLYRSESSGTLYQSFERGPNGTGRNVRRNVTAIVDRLNLRLVPLLRIGEQDGLTRPWSLTDAGREWLAKHDTPEVPG